MTTPFRPRAPIKTATQAMARAPPPFMGAPFAVQQRRAALGMPTMAKQTQLTAAVAAVPAPIVVPATGAAAAAATAEEPHDEESIGYPMTQYDDEEPVAVDRWDLEEEAELKAIEEAKPAAAAAAAVIDLTGEETESEAPPAKKRKGPTEGKSKLVYYEKVYVKQGRALIEAYIRKSAFVHPDVLWGEVVSSDVEDPEVVDDSLM